MNNGFTGYREKCNEMIRTFLNSQLRSFLLDLIYSAAAESSSLTDLIRSSLTENEKGKKNSILSPSNREKILCHGASQKYINEADALLRRNKRYDLDRLLRDADDDAITTLFDKRIEEMHNDEEINEFCRFALYNAADVQSCVKMILWSRCSAFKNKLGQWSPDTNKRNKPVYEDFCYKVINVRNSVSHEITSSENNELYGDVKKEIIGDVGHIRALINSFSRIPEKEKNVINKQREALGAIDSIESKVSYAPIRYDELEDKNEYVTIDWLSSTNFWADFDLKENVIFFHSETEVNRALEDLEERRKNTEELLKNRGINEKYSEIKKLASDFTSSVNNIIKNDESFHSGWHDDQKGVERDADRGVQTSVDDVAEPCATDDTTLDVSKLFPHMSGYDGRQLTSRQIDELMGGTVVMADARFWMRTGSRTNTRHFVAGKLKDILVKNNNAMVVDWDTRVELFGVEKNSGAVYSDSDVKCAKIAHNIMTLMVGKNYMRYLPPTRDFLSSEAGIIKIAKDNPDVIFSVFTGSNELCKLIEENDLLNVIPLDYVEVTGKCNIRSRAKDRVKRIFGSNVMSENNYIHRGNGDSSRSNSDADHNVDVEDNVTDEKNNNGNKKKEKNQVNNQRKRENRAKRESGIKPENNIILRSDETPDAGDTVHTKTGEQVRLVDRIGEGGEGAVYKTDQQGRVAKIYWNDHRTQNRKEKLELMVSVSFNNERVCWPEELLYDGQGVFAGYLMRDISGYKEFGVTVLKLNSPTVLRKHMSGWDRLALVKLCIAICDTFIALHKKRILMGDVNARNIMIDPKSGSYSDFVFVDCDSYQIEEYPCPVGTINFTSPQIYRRNNATTESLEFGKILRTLADEDYSVASLLFHILMLNQSPYATKGNADIKDNIINYKFGYRLNNKSGRSNSGVDTPDGPYRMIWNNTPWYIKELFGKVFQDAEDVSMNKWRYNLIRYERDIEGMMYTRELTPVLYRDPDNKYTTMFRCSMCGQERNMPNDRFDNEEEHFIPHICNQCRPIRDIMERTNASASCVRCGRRFDTNEWELWRFENTKKKPLCPSCRREKREFFRGRDK